MRLGAPQNNNLYAAKQRAQEKSAQLKNELKDLKQEQKTLKKAVDKNTHRKYSPLKLLEKKETKEARTAGLVQARADLRAKEIQISQVELKRNAYKDQLKIVAQLRGSGLRKSEAEKTYQDQKLAHKTTVDNYGTSIAKIQNELAIWTSITPTTIEQAEQKDARVAELSDALQVVVDDKNAYMTEWRATRIQSSKAQLGNDEIGRNLGLGHMTPDGSDGVGSDHGNTPSLSSVVDSSDHASFNPGDDGLAPGFGAGSSRQMREETAKNTKRNSWTPNLSSQTSFDGIVDERGSLKSTTSNPANDNDPMYAVNVRTQRAPDRNSGHTFESFLGEQTVKPESVISKRLSTFSNRMSGIFSAPAEAPAAPASDAGSRKSVSFSPAGFDFPFELRQVYDRTPTPSSEEGGNNRPGTPMDFMRYNGESSRMSGPQAALNALNGDFVEDYDADEAVVSMAQEVPLYRPRGGSNPDVSTTAPVFTRQRPNTISAQPMDAFSQSVPEGRLSSDSEGSDNGMITIS